MQIAICEDDPTLASILENHILEVSRDFAELDCEIDVYDCPTDYIKHHQKNYDLYFLDIEFDNCNTTGLDLARHLSEDPEERGQIIFVSSHPGYSIESIRYRPYRYLVKPVDRPQIETLFTELIRDFNADKSYIRFHRGKDNVYVHTSRFIHMQIKQTPTALSVLISNRPNTIKLSKNGAQDSEKGRNRTGIGIASIRERVSALDGYSSFHMGDGVFQVLVQIPLAD